MHLFGHNLDHEYCSNSLVKGSGTPYQFLGVLVHTMAMSGLSRVRTEVFQLLVIPSLAPHPVQTNRESPRHGYLGDLSSPPQLSNNLHCNLSQSGSVKQRQRVGFAPRNNEPTMFCEARLFSGGVMSSLARMVLVRANARLREEPEEEEDEDKHDGNEDDDDDKEDDGYSE